MLHAIGLLVGILAGVWVARFVAEQATLPPVLGAVVLAAFIFIFQAAAYVLSNRESAPSAVPVVEVPVMRGSETWAWLKPASGVGAGFPLARERINIGRGVDMDITLNNASISRHHAELRRLMDGALLRDAGSRNGVFVNGERVQEQLLSDGDTVALGELRFVFVQVRPARASQEVPTRAEEPPSPEVREDSRDSRPFDDTSDYTNI